MVPLELSLIPSAHSGQAGELFGSYNDSSATAADCCAQCKRLSFVTPQMPTPCVNYTFNDTSKRCVVSDSYL